MRNLRPLGLLLFLTTVFVVSIPSWGEAPSVGMVVSSFSQTGATHLNLLENAQASGGQQTSIKASSGLMKQGLRLNLSAIHLSRDLGDYSLMERNGSITSLGDRFDGEEQMASFGVDYVKGPWTVNSEIRQTLSQSPLSQRQGSLKVIYQMPRWGSQLSLSHVRAIQDQPASFYIDPESFATKARATQLRPAITRLTYDQIHSERWKSQLTLMGGERPEDRPRHLGAGYRLAYAMGDTWALHAGAEAIRESRSDQLKDSRGYFDLDEFDIGVAIEPTYNLIIRALVGTAIERESKRGSVPKQTVGTDKIDLQVEYRKARLSLFLQGNLQETNTKLKASQLSGGATWEI